MSGYLKLLILFVIVMIPVYFIAKAAGAARKRRMIGALDERPIADLHAELRALWPKGEHWESILVYRLTASQYGTKIEALTETLLEATFNQKTGHEENLRFLATHYVWLLDLLLRFLEANWSWADTAGKPGKARFQVFFNEPDPVNPPVVARRYPRAIKELAAGAVSQTLAWLERLARRQNELSGIWAPADGALRSIPKWDAAIFASRDHVQTAGMLHQTLIEINCPPAVLRKEIERLRPQPVL